MRIDRVQVVVADAEDAAKRWAALTGAVAVRQDALRGVAARRRVLALGESEVEILEPDGSGEAADFVAGTGGGLYAAGVAVADVEATAARLEGAGVSVVREGPQLLLSPESLGIPGLRLVISPQAERSRRGLARFLYEVTLLCADAPAATARFASLFGLDPRRFVPIRSAEFGYEGTLTLFAPDRLDRIEIGRALRRDRA